jgi:hypothetical protein
LLLLNKIISMSKLESSIPNEILIHLLENYINPIDVFVAFANHLNNRFDTLIDQCQWFHLDLTNVRKKEFHHCINNLFTYRNKIQSLFLSERLPGQICKFLSLFPTFDHNLNVSLNFIWILILAESMKIFWIQHYTRYPKRKFIRCQ